MQVSSKEVTVEAPLKLRSFPNEKITEADTVYLRQILEQREREVYMKKRGLNETSFDEEEEKRKKVALLEQPDLDADASLSDISSGSSDEESFEDDKSSDGGLSIDEEEELRKELEKIKKEREEERLAELKAKAKDEEEKRKSYALESNELLIPESQDFSISRKWYDDTIFKNQAKKVPDVPDKRFIGDMLRSDFQKKFMKRYIM